MDDKQEIMWKEVLVFHLRGKIVIAGTELSFLVQPVQLIIP
jgi:hypothetical protein